MNSNKEFDNAEKKKIMDICESLEKTVEMNTQNIVSYKCKLDTTIEGITLNKDMIKKYEEKLEALMTEHLNVEWNQTKAKTVQKADREYIKNLQLKRCTEPEDTPNRWKSLEDKENEIAKLVEQKNNLEKECNTNIEKTEELLREYYKLKNECELSTEN